MPDREPEIPSESEAMASIRVWRQSERKDMIDAIDELISQARRAAKSQYTRSAKKAQWTRLAGQLIWYKDQIRSILRPVCGLDNSTNYIAFSD